MNLRRRIVLTIVALLALIVPLAAQGKRHVVIAGSDSIPPMEFYDKNGHPAGFNIELISTVMERLGYDYSIMLVPSDSLVPMYNSGRADVIPGASYLNVDPVLANQSNIIVLMYMSIVSRREDNYTSIEDLEGKTVAFANQSDRFLMNDTSFKGSVVYAHNPQSALNGVATGKYDAAITRFYVGRAIVKQDGLDNLVLQPMNVPPVEQRIMANDRDLAMQITGELTRMRRDGSYDRIYGKWLRESSFYAEHSTEIIAIAVLLVVAVLMLILRLMQKVRKNRRLLRKERDRLAILMDAGGLDGYEIDIESMRVTRISSEGHASTQITLDEMIDTIHPKDRPIVMRDVEAASQGRDVRGEATVRFVPPPGRESVGGYRYYSLFSQVIRQKGRIKLFYVKKDVHDSHTAQTELYVYHERMNLALKNTGITQWDYDTVRRRITVRNGFHIEDGGTLTREAYLALWPAVAPVLDVLEKGEVTTLSQDLTLKFPGRDDPHYVTIMARAIAFDDDGKATLYTGVRKDVTDLIKEQLELQRAKEKAEEADQLKTHFLANMSHEIRTPLNAIVGFASLLGDASDDEREQYVDIINDNASVLLSLVNDVLDMSNIVNGDFELHPETFDFAKDFNEVASSMSKHFDGTDIDFIVDSPYKSCVLSFDKMRINQVMVNFMSNAIKYTAKGHVKMGYSYDPDKGELTISVEDTGVGISEENYGRVFQRFEKFDNFVQGAGLELAIVKTIADVSGSTVGFTSKKDEGSTFYFIAPCKAQVSKKEKAAG